MCVCVCVCSGGARGGVYEVLPQGYWWSVLYGSVLLLLCLLVCLVGVDIYAKATFLIFLLVMLVLATVFISFFAVRPHTIVLPPLPPPPPNTNKQTHTHTIRTIQVNSYVNSSTLEVVRHYFKTNDRNNLRLLPRLLIDAEFVCH